MKIISISKEQVPSALANKISYVIEPVKEICICASYWDMNSEVENPCRICDKKGNIYNKPNQVGYQMELVFNPESKYEWFCPMCGKEVIKRAFNTDWAVCSNHIQDLVKPFNKHIRKLKAIEESFEVQIYDNPKYGFLICDQFGHIYSDDEIGKLAKGSGFPNAESFFKSLDIKEPTTFWVTKVEGVR